MKKADNIIQACEDPQLFKGLFRDLGTWANWFTFLRALFGLPFTNEHEISVYRQCTGRTQLPSKPFPEAWVIAGRRSGKSFMAALIAVFVAVFRVFTPYVSPGERVFVLVLAADRAQAAVILNYIKGFLNSNSMFQEMIQNEKAESIDLTNRVTIAVATCSYKAVRGFTAACIICDEVAFWKSDDGRNPAKETLRALRPTLATIPNSPLICITTAFMKSGPVWDAVTKHHAQDSSAVLTWRASSRLMNPTISQELIDRDMVNDPEAAKSEWFGKFRSDLSSLFPDEAIDAVIIPGRFELAPMAGIVYGGFVDSSGGRHDAACLGIAHSDRATQKVILDLARRWPAPHDPASVTAEMASICRSYRISKVTGDRYSAAWIEGEFRNCGIVYEPSTRDKSQLYLSFLPMVLSGKVELLDNKDLQKELRGLERRVRAGGRDTVDHGPMGFDDLANSVAGCCVESVHSEPDSVYAYMKREHERIFGSGSGEDFDPELRGGVFDPSKTEEVRKKILRSFTRS